MNGKILSALKTAFPYTVPVMTGYLFLGISYGIYMNVSGFSFLYPLLMSIVIFGGSLEFLAVSLLLSTFAPLQTFFIALVIQARHLFYGLAMLEKYKGTGLKKTVSYFCPYGRNLFRKLQHDRSGRDRPGLVLFRSFSF